MNNLLDIKSPANPEAKALKSEFGLVNLGLQNLGQVYWNLTTPALYEEALFRREGRIAHAGVEGLAAEALGGAIKRMPVPDVEELAAQLEISLFLDSKVLHEGKVLIVVTEAPVIGDAGSLPQFEVEAVEIFESAGFEQGQVRVEIALGLRPGAHSGEDPGDARRRKLTRHIAVAGAEVEWHACTGAEDRGDRPAADEPVQYSAVVRRPALSIAEGEIINEVLRQGLGHIVHGERLVTFAGER
jgi:hypothetical protein